jgi:hypothetical protein
MEVANRRAVRIILRHAVVLTLILAALAVWQTGAHAQFRYPPDGPYPYGPYRYMSPEASLKLEVTPKEAAVYVDGYFAGTVDEFDGAFQRLRVLPGQHEIVVHLDGYKSITEKLYLGPNTSRKIERTMEKLGPGEPNVPKPEPIAPPEPPQQSPRDPRDPRRGAPPPTA